jgi:hypothetical protein
MSIENLFIHTFNNLIKPNEKAVFYINLQWKYKGGLEGL